MPQPDFIIAGVAKAGTTSLYNYLGEHPEVGLSSKKELNFFAYEDPQIHAGWPKLGFAATTWERYVALFPDSSDSVAVGEASPIYFESEVAPRAISERLPNVKIIISLRNPVERAYSAYLMHVRFGHRPLTDAELVASDERFIVGSYYAEKLQRYFDLFRRDQLAVVLFDDLVARPQEVMRELYSFLGVADADFVPDLSRRHNEGYLPRSRLLGRLVSSHIVMDRITPAMPAWMRRFGQRLARTKAVEAPRMSDEVRLSLQHRFRDDVEATGKMIGRDLSYWVAGS